MTRIARNKYMMERNDGSVTNLVAADSMQEAQDDAARIGAVGTIVDTDLFMEGAKYAGMLLNDARAAKQLLVDIVAGSFNYQFLYMEDSALTTEGQARKAVATYAVQKKLDIATWTESQLDNYDPVSDPQLQV